MIYLALGRRESGKTTLAYSMAQRCRSRVLFDPRGMLPSAPRQPRARTIDDITDAFDRLAGDPYSDVVITPDADVQACFVAMARETRAWLTDDERPKLALLVDELRFVDTRAESFQWILRCTTRAAAAVLLTGHRPIDVPPDIRAIADVWLIFRTTHDADLDLIRDHCSREVADQVRALAPYTFVAWDDTRGAATLYAQPANWFVPLAAPRQLEHLTPHLQAD